MSEPKRPPITFESIPKYGLAYSDQTRARILVMRGKGELVYQGLQIMDHPHPEHLMTCHPPGDLHVTGDTSCNCKAGEMGRECRHKAAVKAAGGTERIKSAFKWWEECKEEERNQV